VSAGAERAFGGDRRRRCGVTHWSVLAELAAQRMSQELRDAEAARRVREAQGGGRERRVRPRPPLAEVLGDPTPGRSLEAGRARVGYGAGGCLCSGAGGTVRMVARPSGTW